MKKMVSFSKNNFLGFDLESPITWIVFAGVAVLIAKFLGLI